MRALIKITLAAAVLYGGYWAVGAAGMRSAVGTALEELRAEGVADYAALRLVGFPSRFDLTVTEPALSAPDGSVAWRAPFLQVFALSYRPNHVIAVWPQSQSLRVGTQAMDVASKDMRASVVFGVGASLPLERASLVAQAVTLSSEAGWGLAVPEARFATRRDGSAANGYQIGVEVLGAVLSPDLTAMIDPEGRLPEKVDWVRIDAVAALDRPLDRFAGTAGGPRLAGLSVREVSLGWGDVRLDASGDLAVRGDGVPEGRIMLSARNWREVVRIAAAAGLLEEGMAATLERGFEQVALAAGDAEVLQLPLIFANGRVSLGPLPLGPAPRF